tara:strand:+ start:12582 stop:12773 length:192 start_codon:yes stop_codon:yes gene_type:complete
MIKITAEESIIRMVKSKGAWHLAESEKLKCKECKSCPSDNDGIKLCDKESHVIVYNIRKGNYE